MRQTPHIALLAAGFAVWSWAAHSTEAPANLRPTAEKYVASQLNDPESARFGEDFFLFADGTGNGLNLFKVCGTVNAKNSYGGYAGPTPYYLSLALDPEEKQPPKFIIMYMDETTAAHCAKRIPDYRAP